MLTAAILACACLGFNASEPEPNTLTARERAEGWRLLFDGTSPTGWRGYRKPGFPDKGWEVDAGVLRVLPGAGGGDIITLDQFADFEFALQFKVAPRANSGIMYRVTEKHPASWQTGPEFQILDDLGHGLPPTHPHSVAAMYDLYTCPEDKPVRPAGEWNDARIRVRHGVVQHFLNGVKVVEERLFDEDGRTPTPDWTARIAASKFKAYEGFGLQPRGHLVLQEHGDLVEFRNIRVRELGPGQPGEISLFNGRDLTGWVAFVPDAPAKGIAPESVWSVEDGVLICRGSPHGYIRTERDYANYILRLEWRFNPVTRQAGNSGVLLRMVGPDKVWPRSIEAQLHSGNAGDFWNIDEFEMKTDPARTRGRNTRKTHAAERPVGEWNEYEIIVHGGDVILRVNGQEVNRAWDARVVPGKIGLQSEGAEIHFRNIRLVPLDEPLARPSSP
jgi:hypothetical protein